MNCQHVRQLLSTERDGRTAGKEAGAVTAHLRDCPACRRFQKEMAAFSGKLRAAGEWEPAPRGDIRRGALERWSAEHAASTPPRQPWHWLAMPALPARATVLGLTAAVLIVAAAGFVWWEQGRRSGIPGPLVVQKGPSTPGALPRGPLPQPPVNHTADRIANGNRTPQDRPGAEQRSNPPHTPAGNPIAPLHHVRSRPPQHPSPERAPGAPVAPRYAVPQAAPGRSLPEEQYLDGRDPSLLAKWSAVGGKEQERLAAILKRLPPPADDFARIPYPQIAGLGGAGIAAAVQEYKDEAKVVDPRLFRKVTLQDKGVALSDFCAELQEQTGVKLSASRAVSDEKVTIFVKDEPARDVMRAVSHLFGSFWMRSGRDGEYRYELDQDLKSQLAEEEMRRRDQDAALVAMDQQAQAFRPYLDLSYDEFRKQWDRLSRREQLPLFNVAMNGGWGGMQLYYRLAPRDRAALLAGQELLFRPDDPNPERRLAADFAHQVLISYNPHVVGEDRPVGELQGARVTQVTLRLDRTELGQITLIAHMALSWPAKYGNARTARDEELATGRNPSTVAPDNSAAHAALRDQRLFKQVISVHPEPTCPQVRAMLAGRSQRLPYGLYSAAIGDLQRPHVFSSDVWEAVHRATGLPIVADYYTRMYRLDRMTIDGKPLFEALCAIGDALGVRWRKEGGFLLARSTSYYWDKRKEVPNRSLLRWQQEERDGPGLSIDTLMQIASLPDEELNSIVVGEAIQHCWGIEEWGLVMPTPFQGATTFRDDLRFMAELTPEHRRRALSPGGMHMTELTPAEQRGLMQDWQARLRSARSDSDPMAGFDLVRGHYVVEYVPAGWYVWTPPESSPEHPWALDRRRIIGRTAADTLAAARQIYPAASADQVKLSRAGELSPSFSFGPYPNGWKPAGR